MAYIIGLLSPDEQKVLESRGWEVEDAPAELISEETIHPEQMKMIWVDASMFDIMSGPDWEQ